MTIEAQVVKLLKNQTVILSKQDAILSGISAVAAAVANISTGDSTAVLAALESLDTKVSAIKHDVEDDDTPPEEPTA